MRQTILVMACVAAVALGGCKYRGPEAQTTTVTDTIQAQKASPAPATSNDDALTQTVDIEDGRTAAEGGSLTETASVNTQTATAGRKVVSRKQKAPVKRQK